MDQAETLEQQADAAAAVADYDSARAFLESAIAAGASSVLVYSKLSAMCKAVGDLDAALVAIDNALALSPLDFPALLSRAVILDRLGDPNAGLEYGNALAQMAEGDVVPPQWEAPIAHARRRRDEWRAKVEADLIDTVPANLSSTERSRVDRFISNRAGNTRHFHQEPSDFHFPGLPEVEFHDRADFPGIDELESASAEIRAEFDALIAAEAATMVPYIQYPERVPLRQWKALNHSRDWTAIHLLQNGNLVEANARHCPITMQKLARLDQPHVPTASPNAMFSLLAPRTRIPPHSGVSNTRLVCHLPLIVPPGCGFRVGATMREWRAGEALIFDDTIEHEAWNDSDELRVVLIFDLWPPSLSPAERDCVAAVLAAAGRSAAARL